MCAFSVIIHELAAAIIDEVLEEQRVEEGRAVPPGTVCDGDVVVDPNT